MMVGSSNLPDVLPQGVKGTTNDMAYGAERDGGLPDIGQPERQLGTVSRLENPCFPGHAL
jgi:hypothetical protein